jgi:hypothetical protein
MSAEATLQAHWRGVTETHDYAALCAFADHLAELWPDAIREDAEHQLQTGASLPDLLRLNGFPTLRVRYHLDLKNYDPEKPLFEFLAVSGEARRGRRTEFFPFACETHHPPFDRWEAERVMALVAWLWEAVKPAQPEASPAAA